MCKWHGETCGRLFSCLEFSSNERIVAWLRMMVVQQSLAAGIPNSGFWIELMGTLPLEFARWGLRAEGHCMQDPEDVPGWGARGNGGGASGPHIPSGAPGHRAGRAGRHPERLTHAQTPEGSPTAGHHRRARRPQPPRQRCRPAAGAAALRHASSAAQPAVMHLKFMQAFSCIKICTSELIPLAASSNLSCSRCGCSRQLSRQLSCPFRTNVSSIFFTQVR